MLALQALAKRAHVKFMRVDACFASARKASSCQIHESGMAGDCIIGLMNNCSYLYTIQSAERIYKILNRGLLIGNEIFFNHFISKLQHKDFSNIKEVNYVTLLRNKGVRDVIKKNEPFNDICKDRIRELYKFEVIDYVSKIVDLEDLKLGSKNIAPRRMGYERIQLKEFKISDIIYKNINVKNITYENIFGNSNKDEYYGFHYGQYINLIPESRLKLSGKVTRITPTGPGFYITLSIPKTNHNDKIMSELDTIIINFENFLDTIPKKSHKDILINRNFNDYIGNTPDLYNLNIAIRDDVYEGGNIVVGADFTIKCKFYAEIKHEACTEREEHILSKRNSIIYKMVCKEKMKEITLN